MRGVEYIQTCSVETALTGSLSCSEQKSRRILFDSHCAYAVLCRCVRFPLHFSSFYPAVCKPESSRSCLSSLLSFSFISPLPQRILCFHSEMVQPREIACAERCLRPPLAANLSIPAIQHRSFSSSALFHKVPHASTQTSHHRRWQA